jgi:hypothetical protein
MSISKCSRRSEAINDSALSIRLNSTNWSHEMNEAIAVKHPDAATPMLLEPERSNTTADNARAYSLTGEPT